MAERSPRRRRAGALILLLVLAGCASSREAPSSGAGDGAGDGGWPWRQSFCPALSEAVRRVRDGFGPGSEPAPSLLPGGAACRIQASGAPAYACGWAIPPGRRDAAVAALAGDVRNCLESMITASSPQPGGQSLQLDNGMRVGIDAAGPGLILSLAPPSGLR